MTVRRIVTGHAPDGKSIFLSDAPTPRETAFKHIPGFVTALVWETRPNAVIPATDVDPSLAAPSWVPTPGGTNVLVVSFPPEAVMASPTFDPAAAGAEYVQVLPGLAEAFEMDSPGMHSTETIDYGVLLAGEIHLELDDGATKKLAPFDVVIQNGTRHAWRNRSDKPATMLFVLIGARRLGRLGSADA